MNLSQELHSRIRRNGKITKADVESIRHCVEQDGQLDLADMKMLVELLCAAVEVCPEFDDFFFPCLRKAVLADGRIGSDEQFYLLKMLYSDGHVRDCEKRFLVELRRDVQELTPEFESLCEIAMQAAPTNWDLGGRSRF
jgi:hypothetical protein